MIALICTLLSAACFWFAHGLTDVWWLAWIAPTPILWLAFGNGSSRAVALAAFGAYLIGELGAFQVYFATSGPILLVAAAIPALAFAAVVLLARLAVRRLPPLAGVLAFPAIWTAWEWAFSRISPNGSFGSWAYSQVGQPVLLQSGALFGLWSVSFLIALVAAGIALTARSRRPGPMVLATAVLAMTVGFGFWRLAQPAGETVRVAAAARDFQGMRPTPTIAAEQAAEVRRLAAQGAKMVVFQEKAGLVPAAQRRESLAPLIAVARETGVTIVTGFVEKGGKVSNSAFTITPDGRVRAYVKRHHVPGLELGYTPGPGPGLLGGRLATAICKDMDFQETLLGDARAGAASQQGVGLMLVPAWDFDADGWAHARMAMLRGVEGGYAVVRAASNGLVTVSDSRGRLLAQAGSGQGRYASVIADVAMGDGPTPYVRFGDVFAWASIALGLLLTGWAFAARPR